MKRTKELTGGGVKLQCQLRENGDLVVTVDTNFRSYMKVADEDSIPSFWRDYTESILDEIFEAFQAAKRKEENERNSRTT